jgi:hypothetical protein
MRSIYVPLPEGATDRLWQLARRELRDPKAQAAVLILEGLRRAGLPVEPEPDDPADLRRAVGTEATR